MKNYFFYLCNLLKEINNNVYPYLQRTGLPEYALRKSLRSQINPCLVPKPFNKNFEPPMKPLYL